LLEQKTQEIKAEVFNYQQINKMETINSIRQFCNEGPVMVETEKNRQGREKEGAKKNETV